MKSKAYEVEKHKEERYRVVGGGGETLHCLSALHSSYAFVYLRDSVAASPQMSRSRERAAVMHVQ